jgi:hypothetical protein
MSTSVEHAHMDLEPVVDTRWHRTLLSLGIGLSLAAMTLAYVYFATVGHDPALFVSIAPFIFVASLAGVGVPAYLATDMVHHKNWLQAAAASCLALFMAFLIFWSAALVATTGPSGVHLGDSPVVVTVKFDPAAWRTDVAARLAMAQDLCSSGRLRGLTSDQVRAELGEPMSTVGPGVAEMCYAVDPAGLQAASIGAKQKAKTMLLRVLFSTRGRVASVALGN